MKHLTLTTVLVASSLLIGAPVFAQTSGSSSAQPTVKKQQTQSNPAGQYNFKPASGSYAPRATDATKQKTDGEDVTGNNNFKPLSK